MAIFTLSILNLLDSTMEPVADLAVGGNCDVFQLVDRAASFVQIGEEAHLVDASTPERSNSMRIRRNAPGRTGFEWNIGGGWRRFAA